MHFADNRAARMLEAGRLTVTVKSKRSGKHVSLKFNCRKKTYDNRRGLRWTSSNWDEMVCCFVNDAVDHNYRVGTYFPGDPPRLDTKRARGDKAREWAARQVINYVSSGTRHPDVEITESNHCGRCARPLTDPVSIQRGIGPECYGKSTGSKATRKVAGKTTEEYVEDAKRAWDEAAQRVDDQTQALDPIPGIGQGQMTAADLDKAIRHLRATGQKYWTPTGTCAIQEQEKEIHTCRRSFSAGPNLTVTIDFDEDEEEVQF